MIANGSSKRSETTAAASISFRGLCSRSVSCRGAIDNIHLEVWLGQEGSRDPGGCRV